MLGLTRRLLYNSNSKPKKTDNTLLAQFYYADVDLCNVAAELDSFDGRKNPARCAALVAQLRQYQDHVLRLIQDMMDEVIKNQRASRDFRIKYPEDLIQEGLAGQLWFGAECLAAGSSILSREVESESMRPLAKNLTKQLDNLRHMLREQSTRHPLTYTDKIRSAFVKFDQTFAEFELSYVSAMVPVKTMKEYDMSQEVAVLFSETVHRALAQSLITTDMLEYCDPELMFTIPRLAIVSGLVFFPEGPLNPDRRAQDMSELFRPFQSLLRRIRELLWTLTQGELRHLERLLCNLEQPVETESSAQSITRRQAHARPEATHRSSLFHDISNVDLHSSTDSIESDNEVRSSANDFRIALLDVLAGSTSPPSEGNNNLSQHANTARQYQTVPMGAIVNDAETGIARLIIGSSQTAHELGAVTPHNRQAPAGSTTSQSSQFAFHLPSSSATNESSPPSGELSTPARLTLDRAASLELANGRPPLAGRNNIPHSSDTDSSSSSSHSDSSSSSSRGTSPTRPVHLTRRTESLRNNYRSSQELLQKLFVCISGVADQLQSNFACDLRNILKCVFDLHTGDDLENGREKKERPSTISNNQEAPPTWVPDSEMDKCCSCRLPFTLIRRRHHCRNCGLIFCGRCSANTAPLPNYGYERAVRICNKCYVYRINPFFMDDSTEESYNSASSRQQC